MGRAGVTDTDRDVEVGEVVERDGFVFCDVPRGTDPMSVGPEKATMGEGTIREGTQVQRFSSTRWAMCSRTSGVSRVNAMWP